MNRRKDYWNKDYYDYWKKRVEEANLSPQKSSNIIEGDTKAPGDNTIKWLINQSKIKNGTILEVGCGWGRLFKIYAKLDLLIYAIDISKKMVEEARRNKIKQIAEIKEAEVEKLPYDNNFFDYISCFGTFDATYQDKALTDMMRVLKLGGKILLTGKNLNYYEDDELAIEAEKGARRKGHPNYFTDVMSVKSQLLNKGHKIFLEYYFIKRGDYAKLKFQEKMPEKFYEYYLVIQKCSESYEFDKFYYEYSNVKVGNE